AEDVGGNLPAVAEDDLAGVDDDVAAAAGIEAADADAAMVDQQLGSGDLDVAAPAHAERIQRAGLAVDEPVAGDVDDPGGVDADRLGVAGGDAAGADLAAVQQQCPGFDVDPAALPAGGAVGRQDRPDRGYGLSQGIASARIEDDRASADEHVAA